MYSRSLRENTVCKESKKEACLKHHKIKHLPIYGLFYIIDNFINVTFLNIICIFVDIFCNIIDFSDYIKFRKILIDK